MTLCYRKVGLRCGEKPTDPPLRQLSPSPLTSSMRIISNPLPHSIGKTEDIYLPTMDSEDEPDLQPRQRPTGLTQV